MPLPIDINLHAFTSDLHATSLTTSPLSPPPPIPRDLPTTNKKTTPTREHPSRDDDGGGGDGRPPRHKVKLESKITGLGYT